MKCKLCDNFKDFYECIRLNEQSTELKSKRDILQTDIEKKLPGKLSEIGINLSKSDLRFIDQGSYAKGVKTTIEPIEGAIDRDVAVIIPIDIDSHDDPRVIKGLVRDILEIKDKRIPKIKYPCVTISYKKDNVEWLHIDFPIYALHDDGNLYLAKGKYTATDYEWEVSDPEGLNNYLKEKLGTDEGKQLRRVIRYLKRWRDEKYNNPISTNQTPPSIALTLMACEHFQFRKENGYENDLESLYNTVLGMLNDFDIYYEGDVKKASIDYFLPVEPYGNVFYKMKDSKEHQTTFFNRLTSLKSNLQNAINAETEYDAGVYVRRSLGSDFEIPSKEAENNSKVKKENSFA